MSIGNITSIQTDMTRAEYEAWRASIFPLLLNEIGDKYPTVRDLKLPLFMAATLNIVIEEFDPLCKYVSAISQDILITVFNNPEKYFKVIFADEIRFTEPTTRVCPYCMEDFEFTCEFNKHVDNHKYLGDIPQ